MQRTWTCSGCHKAVADDSDMLVEIDTKVGSQIAHVDHLTAIGLKMRVRFYGPYCDRACWDIDARPDDEFVDVGRFTFDDEPART